ncbi:MAG: tail fiber domain-containing protein [Chloroflexota bacterium]
MKRKSMINLLLVTICLLLSLSGTLFLRYNALAQSEPASQTSMSAPNAVEAELGSAISYQGSLKQGGNPANGTFDFVLAMYGSATGTDLLFTPQTFNDVVVVDGIFTIPSLDFGPYGFQGEARFLEIRVDGTTLSPRQELKPVPPALSLPGLWTLENSTSPSLIGGYPGNEISFSAVGATIGGGGQSGDKNHIIMSYGTVGGGANNFVGSQYGTVAGGNGNQATGTAATVAGGDTNRAKASYSIVSGGFDNSIESAASYSTLAGGQTNFVNSGSYGTIGGGRANEIFESYGTIAGGNDNMIEASTGTIGGGESHRVTDRGGTVSGGVDNRAGDNAGTATDANYATVGGGYQNIASGGGSVVAGGDTNRASDEQASVVGGGNNTASGGYSFLGGGEDNIADGDFSTLGGGIDNQTSGDFSTIPGGEANIAQGNASFAAGREAQALHNGTFVWSDGSGGAVASTAVNQFITRAAGGTIFYSNSAATAGVNLAPGNGSWSSLSDRNVKANVEVVDGRDILDQLASIPIATWNYTSQDESIRHIGPMAQDFQAAFAVGEDETRISTIDADGVALAAIQGLNDIVTEQEGEIEALEAQIERLETAVLAQSSPQTNPFNWLLLSGIAAFWLFSEWRRRQGGQA